MKSKICHIVTEFERAASLIFYKGLTTINNLHVFHVKDSEYRNALSEGVLRLQESGRLATLKIKWWNEKKGNLIEPLHFHDQ